MRPAELLGTKWSDIRPVRDTDKGNQDNVVITIDGERCKMLIVRGVHEPCRKATMGARISLNR